MAEERVMSDRCCCGRITDKEAPHFDLIDSPPPETAR